MTGVICGDPFVETVKNGEAKALFAQVRLSHDGEVRTVQLFPGINADRWPCKGDVVVVERSGGLLYAAAVWDKEEPKLKPGEYEIYSRDQGRKRVARIYLDAKGKLFINADDDMEITAKNLKIEIEENIEIKGKNMKTETGQTYKVKAGTTFDAESSGDMTNKSGGNLTEIAAGIHNHKP